MIYLIRYLNNQVHAKCMNMMIVDNMYCMHIASNFQMELKVNWQRL